MAQNETPITVVGNLVADPELRFIPSGAAVANFRIASTPRSYNRETNQFEDGEALFLTCNCWRQMAENVAETLTKGMRVIVQGRLRQRSYQTREGENRTVFEVEVDEVGPSLKFASASVSRTPREGGGQQRQPQQFQQPQQQQAPQGFQQPSQPQQSQPQQSQQPANDPWNSAPPAGGFGGMDDEPPF